MPAAGVSGLRLPTVCKGRRRRPMLAEAADEEGVHPEKTAAGALYPVQRIQLLTAPNPAPIDVRAVGRAEIFQLISFTILYQTEMPGGKSRIRDIQQISAKDQIVSGHQQTHGCSLRFLPGAEDHVFPGAALSQRHGLHSLRQPGLKPAFRFRIPLAAQMIRCEAEQFSHDACAAARSPVPATPATAPASRLCSGLQSAARSPCRRL